ncbi:MAG TPA: peptidoglycan DD-metalloendopeptidase family protein [Spirochaetota bacterium]|nr:peptidoglycan DD-metalloendopeptidase family protein [Spirochaetota bacterium]
MKKYAFLILIILFPFCIASAAVTPEQIADKSKLQREEIIKKDEERRAKIIKKFYDFQVKVKNFAPDMKINIPVNPDKAEDINELDNPSKIIKQTEYYAFAADRYKLRALPYDSVKEFTASVSRGERVLVLMKPEVKKNQTYTSITKEWLLIRTGDGTEGYIPLNLMLNKKPDGIKKNSRMFNDSFLPEKNFCYNKGINISDGENLFVLAQYSDEGSSQTELKNMKVNASVLKVRPEPSFESESVASLYKNDIVEVIEYSAHSDYYEGKYSKWAKIKKDNVTGWVFAYYLTEVKDSDEVKNDDLVSYLSRGAGLYVKSDILRVRDAPDDYSTVLFSLENKNKVEVTEIEDEEVTLGGKKSKWVKIKYLDYEGWVFGAFLSKDKNAYEEGDDINNLFQIPITDDGFFISSKFGKRILNGKTSNHTGIDLAAPLGTKVVAAADGTVIYVNDDQRNCSSCGYGAHVIIEHKNGYRTVYGHLSAVSVKNGQKLNSGEKVGEVGNTGHSYGNHLHFEIRAYEEFVDPMNYIHP